jgi:hypothetical protein
VYVSAATRQGGSPVAFWLLSMMPYDAFFGGEVLLSKEIKRLEREGFIL